MIKYQIKENNQEILETLLQMNRRHWKSR